jgi:hypothetical protein
MTRFLPILILASVVLGASMHAVEIIETDVCVYGGTSGGVIAAVQAARLGKSVVLLSTNNHVGGMTSGGLGNTDAGTTAAIGGLALEFYRRIGTRYGSSEPQFSFEPHVAEEEFNALLAGSHVPVRMQQRLASVTKSGQRLEQITMDDGTVYRAGMFIDTSYEGDLMAAAGVTWTMGRESPAIYGESFNGITSGVGSHQFEVNVDPYVTPGVPASGLLPFVQSGDGGIIGASDTRLQAYNYRLCLTSDAANRNPIVPPPGYDEARFEFLGRLIDARIAAGQSLSIYQFLSFHPLPNQKTDNNNSGPFSTDYVGGNYNYVTASHAQREQLAREHLEYIQGFLYYMGHSLRVPASVRAQLYAFGTCRDEFQDTGGWPHQLYVRESRRMVSDYVMQQGDCTGARIVDDSIGLASYNIDTHAVQRVVKNGFAWNEGDVQKELPKPFRVSYRSIVPRQGECENLLVPWALSASHVAFGSIRMEPVFMILSQSAATAAACAMDENAAVQQVDYSKLALQLVADGQLLDWGAAGPQGIIVDNGDATGVAVNGAWTSSSATAGFLGQDYLHDGNGGKGTKSVRFTPPLPTTGLYDVYLRWTAAGNRSANVPVDVTHANGVTTFTVNQTLNGGTWARLTTSGPLTFNAGTSGNVLVRTTGTSGFVVADSVRFVPVTAPDAVQIVASDAVAREADPSDHAHFTVIRAADQVASNWVIPYSVAGSATPGADYSTLSGSVTIPAGAISASIDVAALPDDIPEGDETVTVTLQPGAGFSIGPNFSATVRILDRPIDRWRYANFSTAELADPLISADAADPDRDNYANLTEYALGLAPLLGESSATPTNWDDTGHLTLTYLRRRQATDVVVAVEGSTDLETWTTANTVVEEISRIPQGAFDLVTVRLVPPNTAAGFLRVRVTRQ